MSTAEPDTYKIVGGPSFEQLLNCLRSKEDRFAGEPQYTFKMLPVRASGLRPPKRDVRPDVLGLHVESGDGNWIVTAHFFFDGVEGMRTGKAVYNVRERTGRVTFT